MNDLFEDLRSIKILNRLNWYLDRNIQMRTTYYHRFLIDYMRYSFEHSQKHISSDFWIYFRITDLNVIIKYHVNITDKERMFFDRKDVHNF